MIKITEGTLYLSFFIQSSKDKGGDEKYSDDFISDHITESIPSYQQASSNLPKPEKISSSLIEESIPEAVSKDNSAPYKNTKFDASGK